MAQTEKFKDVLLNGKPAKLNLVTGEVTYVNGQIASNRAAKKLKDSVLSSRTEIKTNLIVDMPSVSEYTEDQAVAKSADQVEMVEEISDATAETEDIAVVEDRSNIEEQPSNQEQPFNNTRESVAKVIENFHIVKKDETLYSIAKRYNTTVGKILIANNLDTTIIKQGQKLLIYGNNSSTNMPIVKWIVSRGDTLIGLAATHNTTVADIKILNNLKSDTIKIGQELKIQQNSEVAKK